jgi:apolipoprotein D and lipocalin family protein
MFRRSACFCAIAAVFIFAGCAGQPTAPLDTVASVDLARYAGKWFEIALLPNKFQTVCMADTQAQYRSEGNLIRVTNRCRKKDGSLAVANGVAKIVEGSANAKLRVSFFRPFYGDYWVLALDPEYRWVLVGEPQRKYGWILSRSPKMDVGDLQLALNKAAELGYARDAFKLTPQTKPLD